MKKREGLKMNKRGDVNMLWIVIGAVLGLLVLVSLGYLYGSELKVLWNKMNIFGGGSSVSAVNEACTTLCQMNINGKNRAAYCTNDRKTVIDLSVDQLKALCDNMGTATPNCPDATAATTAQTTHTGANSQSVNFKAKSAVVTCGTLEKASILDAPCDTITC